MKRSDAGAYHMLEIIDGIKREFLFDGYEEFFKMLLPRHGNIVLGHCDT